MSPVSLTFDNNELLHSRTSALSITTNFLPNPGNIWILFFPGWSKEAHQDFMPGTAFYTLLCIMLHMHVWYIHMKKQNFDNTHIDRVAEISPADFSSYQPVTNKHKNCVEHVLSPREFGEYHISTKKQLTSNCEYLSPSFSHEQPTKELRLGAYFN